MDFKKRIENLLTEYETPFVSESLFMSEINAPWAKKDDEHGFEDLKTEYFDDDYEKFLNEEAKSKIKKDWEGIQIKYCDDYGGEDQGSDYWSVYAFTDGQETVYVKTQGWYASYEGSTYEDWTIVSPKTKEMVVYE